MKRYDNYKDSGVQWIGEIPSHWDLIPFRYMTTQLLTGLNPRDNFKLTLDDDFFYVTIKNFKDGVLYLDENCDRINKQAWEIIQSRSDLRVGDILFASISHNGQAYIISEEPKNWNINESVFKIRPDFKKTISSFLYYCITNDGFFDEMFSESTGSTFKSIKQNKLKAMQLPLPPLAEQEMIVRHLDVKCGEIDKLIATQQRRIELLQELRQSIITRAVTRGINPDVPLHDSGIEWIGQVPSHWEIMPLKRCLKYPLMYGANESAEEDNPDDPRYIRITDIDDFGNLRDETYKTLSIEKAEPYLLKKGDVLFARSGATVGKTYMFKEDYPACFAGYLIKATCNNRLLPNYLLSYSQSGIYNNWKNSVFIQATIQNIGADKYSSLPVILPPLNEQHEIVAHIERETGKVDHALQQAERQIELLQELRQSVITEVVTGKRKVC